MKPTPILAALVLSLAPLPAFCASDRSTSSLLFSAAADISSTDSAPSSTDLDSIRNFQLGKHSYEIVRVGRYDSYINCNGHQARHGMLVMSNIQTHCTNVSELTFPARNPATQLLREGNYFDCGREQLRVDAVDGEDEAQNCVLGFINANNRAWVNGARSVRPFGVMALAGLVCMAMAMV